MIIPPNGFLGFAQSVSAARASLTKAMPGSRINTRQRRKKKRKASTRLGRVTSRARSTGSAKRAARLVAGSAAAKKYMASIRKKRRKKP